MEPIPCHSHYIYITVVPVSDRNNSQKDFWHTASKDFSLSWQGVLEEQFWVAEAGSCHTMVEQGAQRQKELGSNHVWSSKPTLCDYITSHQETHILFCLLLFCFVSELRIEPRAYP